MSDEIEGREISLLVGQSILFSAIIVSIVILVSGFVTVHRVAAAAAADSVADVAVQRPGSR